MFHWQTKANTNKYSSSSEVTSHELRQFNVPEMLSQWEKICEKSLYLHIKYHQMLKEYRKAVLENLVHETMW